MGLKDVPKEFKDEAASVLKSSLNAMEKFWLGDTKYIALDEISIADLSAYCELKQLDIVKYDFSAFPKVTRESLLSNVCTDTRLA